MSIGSRLIGARMAAGFRYASDVARAAGVTKQYLHNLESGLVSKPDPNKLEPICRALNVSMEWVITGRGKPGRDAPVPSTTAHAELLRNYDRLTREEQARVLVWVRRRAAGDPL